MLTLYLAILSKATEVFSLYYSLQRLDIENLRLLLYAMGLVHIY